MGKLTVEQVQRICHDLIEHPLRVHKVTSADIEALRDLALAALGGEKATHEHVKTKGLYSRVGVGKVQTTDGLLDMDEVVIYRSTRDGSWWVRGKKEFEDGRFAALDMRVTWRAGAT